MEITQLRRKNLRSLAQKHSLTKLAVEMLRYSHPSYISTLISDNPKRTFTEKNARKFETKLGLAPGWFDTEHDPVEAPTTAKAQPEVDDETVARIADLIRLVGQVFSSEAVELLPVKFADVVALAYADTVTHAGKPREAHIKQLVRLLK